MKFTRAVRRLTARLTLRSMAWLALVALALNLVGLPAYAGQWRQVEIKWRITSVGSPFNSTGIYVRDTVKTVLAASILDTTGIFSANDADVWPGQGQSSAGASGDTTVVGYLVFQSDTTAAVASAVTSITCEIDGRAGGYGVNTDNQQGWTEVDSIVVSPIADAAFGGTIAVPITAKSDNFLTTGTVGAINNNRFYRLMAYNDLRCRVTATTGIMAAARVFWRYWDDHE